MTREELFKLHEKVCGEALTLMRKKNQDYATGEDPFRNFRMFGRLGFLVRMGDKLARLRTYVEAGKLATTDEGVRDSLIDLINYSILLLAFDSEKDFPSQAQTSQYTIQKTSAVSTPPTPKRRGRRPKLVAPPDSQLDAIGKKIESEIQGTWTETSALLPQSVAIPSYPYQKGSAHTLTERLKVE